MKDKNVRTGKLLSRIGGIICLAIAGVMGYQIRTRYKIHTTIPTRNKRWYKIYTTNLDRYGLSSLHSVGCPFPLNENITYKLPSFCSFFFCLNPYIIARQRIIKHKTMPTQLFSAKQIPMPMIEKAATVANIKKFHFIPPMNVASLLKNAQSYMILFELGKK